MRNSKVMAILIIIVLIVGAIVFYNLQIKNSHRDPYPINDDKSELNINLDDENNEEENLIDENKNNMGEQKSNEDDTITNKNDAKNNEPIIIENTNSKIMLTKKTTFIKSSVGNSYLILDVPETTSVQVSFIIDDCNVDCGYAFILLSKNASSGYGAEFWNSMYFWKQNEIKWDLFYDSSIHTEMRPGTYDLLILSDFGRWGIIIETNLGDEEIEYETPIRNDILFEAIEFGQEDSDKTQFVKEIRFKDTYFNINSNGMLFRFEYIKADMDGYGIESIETEWNLYDPNGESVGGMEHKSWSTYKNDGYVTTGFGWDRIYAERGRWTGSGNCTIETLGKPNTDSFDIHMFEFIIYF